MKITEVPLKDLKTSFFVRKKLNDDRVLQLAELYQSGVKLPPIEINWENEIIDGRHRKAALEMLDRQVAECHSIGQKGTPESIVIALKANMGGALPPTKEDIVHTCMLLLNNGWTERKILDNFQVMFPRDLARKYLKDAWGVVLDGRLKSAMKAISEGLTVKEAAEKFQVPLDKLKNHLNPNRTKRAQKSTAWRKQRLSRYYQGFHRKIAYEVQKTVEDFEDNAISEDEVYEIFDSLFSFIRSGQKRIEDHRTRFDATSKERSKLAAVPIPKHKMKELAAHA